MPQTMIVGRRALLAGVCFALFAGAPLVAAPAKPLAATMNDAAVTARASSLVAQMTAEEKAAQLTQYFYMQPAPPVNKASLQALETTGLGSLLFVTDPVEINRLQRIAVERSRLKIPVLFGFDVIHGFRTIFPVPIGMAASWDPQIVEQAQAVAAAEARAVGVHWAFAPNLDIARDPRWGRIVEGAGEDPYLGSVMAASQVRGFQGPYLGAPGRIIAGPKHFAGYGASLGGRDYAEVNLSESELWNVYLPPFKAAVDAGAGNIMAAYMAVNGVPAAANTELLTKILRKDLGFKGFVVSDSGSVVKLQTQGLATSPEDAASRAVKAGLDLEMTPPLGVPAMNSLPAALKAGRIPEATVDEAVRRVLQAKIRMGLFEQPYVDPVKAEAVLNDPSHRRLARVAAERSAVLLRNEGGLLPLDRKKIKSIALIGPMADSEIDTLGPWVFDQNKPSAVTLLAALKAKFGSSVRIDYSEGVRLPEPLNPPPGPSKPKRSAAPLDEAGEIRRAAELARNADVAVVVIGEAWNMISEGGSRSSFELPGAQQALLDAVTAGGKPVVVVLMSARPLDLKETRAGAILDVWYPGSEGGAAVANLLFGEATPGGKLPFTWIRSAAQAPNYYAQLISNHPERAEKGYWNEPTSPTYPFGYGLSYTTFEYSNLKIEKPAFRRGEPVGVSVDLRNTGDRAGDEVAQLYIHQRSGTASRPARALKGFQRVALRPGETRKIRFTLKPDDLRYWSSETKGWVQDEAVFDVWAGGDSRAQLATTFAVTAQ
ncbi:glycoside hydrolase family 3 C-terminal domain-containing protein [Phenylobacterium sp. LjRoot225]|uniref:glycoside hydrolase family 3 N-terminal domain-containing protein n=1 Tax=Phenylobacterium sp. LjRoot225 TaxID=3342285 RepID=UPI003ECD7B49